MGFPPIQQLPEWTFSPLFCLFHTPLMLSLPYPEGERREGIYLTWGGRHVAVYVLAARQTSDWERMSNEVIPTKVKKKKRNRAQRRV